MPYFISDENPNCNGWSVEKQDGEVIGCHATKQAAIDQMVAVSIAEGMEPGGERVANAAVAVISDIDDTLVFNGTRPIRAVIDVVNDLPGDLFIVTGRVESQRETTMTTLKNAGLRPFIMFMRPDDSVDTISFKIGEAERIAEDYRVTHVFENDDDTRDAYEAAGFFTINPDDLYEDMEDIEDYEDRAEPGELELGDFVRWDSSGGTARGRIEHIMREGTLGIPDSEFSINATEDDPAALIRIFREMDDGWMATETLVGHRFSTLTKIDPLPEPTAERVDNIPEYIREAAARGLELRREGFGGDGLTDQTVREARLMADGTMSDDKVVRANAWGARHAVDLEAGKNSDPEHPEWPGAGAVAHYLWGINPLDPGPARRWLESEVARIRDERKEMGSVEVRTIDAEIRAVGDAPDGMRFGGFAWRYMEPSLPLPFTERIAPGAFTRTLKSRNDVRAYYNHNDELLLGSSRAKTLRIEDRPEGGYVEIDLPDTELGRSVAYHVRRGDITGMSFGFSTVRDEWSADGNERTLKEVRLHEVSVVSGVPAYPTTTTSVRNLKSIAHRTDMDVQELTDAMNALQSGELTDDQANVLRTVVDRMTGKTVDAEPQIPLSVLQKQMELLAKAF